MRARPRKPHLVMLLTLATSLARGAEPYEPVFIQGEHLRASGSHRAAAAKFVEAATLAGNAHPHIWLWAAKECMAATDGPRTMAALSRYQAAGGDPTPAASLRAQARTLITQQGFVLIAPGRFQMGSPPSELERQPNETQQWVTIRQAFVLGKTEVTQGEYQRVMGKNPSQHQTSPDHPIEQVSWYDAVRYCNERSRLEQLIPCYGTNGSPVQNYALCGYRLPTSAEWEYAARAGQATLYAGSNNVEKVGWIGPQNGTHAVGLKIPNTWGLYDMSGNVWEWVWDAAPDGRRMRRGGSWGNRAPSARVAARAFAQPGQPSEYVGFRVARSLPSYP